MLAVSEVFGPTFQGEGPYTGQVVGFLRLAGCNLHCRWCDTSYTWRYSDTHPHDNNVVYNRREEVFTYRRGVLLNKMLGFQLRHWVISGGEPLLQEDELASLLWSHSFQNVHTSFYEIETAGTIQPQSTRWENLDVHYNVSPKLEHSGNSVKERRKIPVLRWFVEQDKAAFKFVVSDIDDLTEINDIIMLAGIPKRKVWIMPLGIHATDVDNRLQNLADIVLDHGWNMTNRMQIQIWGNRRGV